MEISIPMSATMVTVVANLIAKLIHIYLVLGRIIRVCLDFMNIVRIEMTIYTTNIRFVIDQISSLCCIVQISLNISC